MPSKMQKTIEKVRINFYFIYSVGLVGFLFEFSRPLMKLLTPVVLLITAVYAIAKTYYDCREDKRRGLVVWSFSVFAVTVFLEILGVKYGLFFGQYKYGGVLGPSILGVPLIIGINWLIVIMGSVAFSRMYMERILLYSLVSGLLAFLFDLVLEPAAISLGFWEWTGGIPVKNYISWFSITFIFSCMAGHFKLDISNRWAPRLLGAQFLFFIFIRLLIYFNLF